MIMIADITSQHRTLNAWKQLQRSLYIILFLITIFFYIKKSKIKWNKNLQK